MEGVKESLTISVLNSISPHVVMYMYLLNYFT